MGKYEAIDNPQLAEMVEALDHGIEVVVTRDGVPVARLVREATERPPAPNPYFDPVLLEDIHHEIGRFGGGDMIGLVREMRDEDRY